jgi:catalase
VPEQKQTSFEVNGLAESASYNHYDHYTQAGDLYRLMSKEERIRLVENIVAAITPVEREDIKLREIQHFYKADREYGERVAKGLKLPIPQKIN